MKEMAASILLVLVAVLLSLLSAAGPVRAASGDLDARIESAARNSYVFKTYLKDDKIDVDSVNGVVTLKGSVADESHKKLARETVASLPGVKSVDNRLKVTEEISDANSDAWITMKVKATLLFHRNVSAMTDVTTKNGIVVLHGEAKNQAQKDLTTEYVKDVDGVKGVDNEMRIANGSGEPLEKNLVPAIEGVSQAIDDASVTALVKMTLLYHSSTSALNTGVETKDGLVTLSGTASSAAEKDLVTKYVEDVRGVKGVINNMTVDSNRAE